MSQDTIMIVLVIAMVPFSFLLKRLLSKMDLANQEIEKNQKNK